MRPRCLLVFARLYEVELWNFHKTGIEKLQVLVAHVGFLEFSGSLGDEEGKGCLDSWPRPVWTPFRTQIS